MGKKTHSKCCKKNHTHSKKHHEPHNWPSYGKNLENWRKAGPCPFTPENVNTLEVKHTIPVPERCGGGVAVVDDVIYSGFFDGSVAAYTLTGVNLWTRAPGSFTLTGANRIINLTPAVGANALYVMMQGGDIFALNKTTGATLGHGFVDLVATGGAINTNLFSAPVLIEQDNILLVTTAFSLTGDINGSGTVQAFTAWPLSAAPIYAVKLTLSTNPTDWNYGMAGCGIFGSCAVDTDRKYLLVGTGQNYNYPGNTLPNSKTSDALIVLNYLTGAHIATVQFTANDINSPPTTDVKNWDADGGPILLDIQLNPNSPQVTRLIIIGTKEGMAYAVVMDSWQILWSTRMSPPAPTGSTNSGVNSFGTTNGVDKVYFSCIYGLDGTVINFGGSTASSLFELDARTGRINWQTSATYTGMALAPLTYSDGLVWETILRGNVVYQDGLPQVSITRAFDACTGELLYTFKNPGGGSSYSGMTIYKNTAILVASTPPTRTMFIFGLP